MVDSVEQLASLDAGGGEGEIVALPRAGIGSLEQLVARNSRGPEHVHAHSAWAETGHVETLTGAKIERLVLADSFEDLHALGGDRGCCSDGSGTVETKHVIKSLQRIGRAASHPVGRQAVSYVDELQQELLVL